MAEGGESEGERKEASKRLLSEEKALPRQGAKDVVGTGV